MSDKFLEQIADYYTVSPDSQEELADLTFVCPNKRSAMFLKRYIQLRVRGKAVFMPRFATMQAFVSRLAGGASPDRWEALFMLFGAYRRVLARHGREEQAGAFDRFIFWGDIILSDFDDIDKSLADPSRLYTNLHRLHEIRSDYLSDEQKDVIEALWGETPMTRDIDSFWMHVRPGAGDDADTASQRFLALWEVLGEVYVEYRADLAARGLATEGMQARAAAETVRQMPSERFAGSGRRYVFVGLNELCPAEMRMLDRLRDVGAAEFFWDMAPINDMAGEDVGDDRLEVMPRGLRTVERLSRRYPMPADFVPASLPDQREIEIIGIPSAAGQTKMAGERLSRLLASGALSDDMAINTAVVVPDPGMLMPLMMALPPGLGALNVTMALPYSTTTFATLFRSVTAMQARARQRRGRWTFFYKDVLEILAHPHIRLIGADDADDIRSHIMRAALYNVDADELAERAGRLGFIFRPVCSQTDVDEAYGYVQGLLGGMRDALVSVAGAAAAAQSVEIESLNAFTGRLEMLRELIVRYGISMGESTFFMMFERLLASGVLTVTGTPLRGLQVMGVLETRALDFDNIIFLSMNERTFPRRDTVRTMIPNSLRRGYGLPPVEQPESVTAYYFYRAISRARRVTLLYDARPAGKGSGEMSRYLTQLLYGARGFGRKGCTITHAMVDMAGEQPVRRTIEVAKTETVMAELARFRQPGGLNLSASALKTYMQCPLAFYLQYVRGYRIEDEPTDYMPPSMVGDIFHRAMCRLYRPWKGREITAPVIGALLEGDVIRAALLAELSEVRYHSPEPLPDDELSAEARLVLSQLELQVRGMLEAEREAYCRPSFVYIDGERDVTSRWTVCDGLTVNFRMQIDRIDRVRPDGPLRFIDYKTGKDSLSAGKAVGNLFNGDHERHAIFQLLLYCEAYADLVDADACIQPSLHVLRSIMSEGEIRPIMYDSRPMEPYPALKDEFRPLLDGMVRRIFDSTTPFGQPDGSDHCRFCRFIAMCGRNLPKDNNRS